MFARRLVNLLIALLVAAGLLLAPLAAPSLATSGPSIAVNADDMQADETQAMAEDMPCCPDEKKANDCPCPLLALCMLSVSLAAPSEYAVLAARYPSRSAFALPNDLVVDGLGERPPDHPPRLIV